MNILVCIKQVPDTTEIRMDPKTNTLIRAGVPSTVNPFDKYALEAAVQLRETLGRHRDRHEHGAGAGGRRRCASANALGADRWCWVSDRASAARTLMPQATRSHRPCGRSAALT